jgi:large subunit ribosomal protein L17
MRHKFANKTLTANTNYTEALLYNMALSLVNHKRIKTTLVRAKALRSYIERLITIAKKGNTLASFRLLSTKMRSNEDFINKLFEVSKSYVERPGGYTRVLKLGKRHGDNANVALIEFV